MRKLIISLFLSLCITNAYASKFLQIELLGLAGVNFNEIKNLKLNQETSFTYGAIGRLWMKPTKHLRLGVFTKYQNLSPTSIQTQIAQFLPQGIPGFVYPQTTAPIHTMNQGLLLGFEFFNFTPYVGGGYSVTFSNDFHPTWSIEYGVTFKIPILPLSLGIDGNYSRPEFHNHEIEIHKVNFTFGLSF